MTDERDEILMSQLADGELASDQANELLLGVLDDSPSREKLKGLLRLRQATIGWRNRQPDRPVRVVADRPRRSGGGRTTWRLGGLAAAACIGGLLVLAGVWAARWLVALPRFQPPRETVATAAPRVTAEQMRQVASILALHESVAGPLAWYASDDQNATLAPAGGTGAQSMPIAMLLKLVPTASGGATRTYMIICREKQPAMITLPVDSPGGSALRVYLTPRTLNGQVEMRYAIEVGDDAQPAAQASLAGQRRVGLTQTQLGQLAVGDKLLNVEATAWPIR